MFEISVEDNPQADQDGRQYLPGRIVIGTFSEMLQMNIETSASTYRKWWKWAAAVISVESIVVFPTAVPGRLKEVNPAWIARLNCEEVTFISSVLPRKFIIIDAECIKLSAKAKKDLWPDFDNEEISRWSVQLSDFKYFSQKI
jgi:hypothetical protein